MPSPTTVLLRTQSDERLVALTRAGHESAFEAIVERYRKPLVRACRRILSEARAEDAVQQALVAAWTGLMRGDEVRELRPWLYRIAHNTALNQLRIAGYDYDELQGLLDSGPAADEELERREVARRTLTGLAALPPRQREALLQIAVQGRGQEEVARAMGVSEPAVRQLVHRARTQLRAAATALTPMPLAGWLADFGARSGPVADRIGEIAAGGGAAGAAATVAKVGAIVVIAGGAAAGPGVVNRMAHGDRGGATAAEARAATRARSGTDKVSAGDVAAVALAPSMHRPRSGPAAKPVTHGTRRHRGSSEDDSSGHGSDHSGPPVTHRRFGRRESGDDDDSSGSGGSGGSDDSSGSGDGGDDSGSGSSGSGGHDGASGDGSGGDGGGGSGSGDDAASPSPEPTADPEPADEPSGGDGGDHHGGSSGSGDGSAAPLITPIPTPTSSHGAGGSGGGDSVPDSALNAL
jgi:RNA polymerase sigma factor (sigma-70 family)